jgi:hypothetical protein
LSTYTYEIYTRNDVLEIYEKIGEKEDIENIKKLAENIPLDYPVRKTHKEYDEKNKNEYLQRVKISGASECLDREIIYVVIIVIRLNV